MFVWPAMAFAGLRLTRVGTGVDDVVGILQLRVRPTAVCRCLVSAPRSQAVRELQVTEPGVALARDLARTGHHALMSQRRFPDHRAGSGEPRLCHRRECFSPNPALIMARATAAHHGFVGLPQKWTPRWLQQVWLFLLWHHRLAWYMAARRVILTRDGVLVFAGTGSDVSAWAQFIYSTSAVVTLMAFYLAAPVVGLRLVLVLLQELSLVGAAYWWGIIAPYAILFPAVLAGLFLMTRPRHVAFKLEARLVVGAGAGVVYGAGDRIWLVLALASVGENKNYTMAALATRLLRLARDQQHTVVIDMETPVAIEVLTLGFRAVVIDEWSLWVARPENHHLHMGRQDRTTPALALLLLLVLVALLLGSLVQLVVYPAEAAFCEDPLVTECMQTRGDAFYWAVTTATTTGYGDVLPHTVIARLAATGLMLFGVIFWAVLINLFASAISDFSAERQRRATELEELLRLKEEPDLRQALLEIRRRLDDLLHD